MSSASRHRAARHGKLRISKMCGHRAARVSSSSVSTPPYRAGCPASGGNQRKFKFTQSATCRVLSISEKKRSVEIGVLAEDGCDSCRPVGNVTILPNFPVPAVGALVEVKYLYYFEGGSLYQSIYLGQRDDKTRPDTLARIIHIRSIAKHSVGDLRVT